MTRDEFLKRMRRDLTGLPADRIEDVLSDYTAHFDAAAEDGRSEAEVAEALGDPGRLARELRLEAGIRNWQEVRSPSNAWTAVIALLGLGAIDILILLPILASVVGVMFGIFVAMIGLFIGGGGVLIIGPFQAFPGGTAAAILTGLGMMAASVAGTALLTIVTIWLVNALMWFGRLHYRVVKPAIDAQA